MFSESTITITLLLAAATGLIHGSNLLYQCSMWGDPQLITFPTSSIASAQHTFCSFEGHAVLYRSRNVLISVRSAPQGDLVLDFNVVLFNDAHVPICTVNALDFITAARSCDIEIVIDKTDSRNINIQYRRVQFSAWIQNLGTHYKITLFTTLAHITNAGTTGMCVQGCVTRSIESASSERTANMTDAQIVTSALAAKVCDLFIAQTVSTLPRTAQSSPGYVNAVRQGCITDVTLTGDSRLAGEGIENIYTDAILHEGNISLENISQLTTNVSAISVETTQIADSQVEKLVASATWPCRPDVPVCIMPSLVRSRMAALLGK